MKISDSVFNHFRNIEREAEVVKNVLRAVCLQSALNARDMGHAAVAAKFLELRDEVDAIYPKNLKVTE